MVWIVDVKLKKAKLETLNVELFVWFCAERERQLLISGPIIQQKALSLNINSYPMETQNSQDCHKLIVKKLYIITTKQIRANH